MPKRKKVSIKCFHYSLHYYLVLHLAEQLCFRLYRFKDVICLTLFYGKTRNIHHQTL